MKRGEEFGKPPKHPIPKPKPKTPVWRKGGPKPTSYEKAEERTTEPEAVTPASPEEGVPQTGAGIHEGPPDTQPPPTPRPWRYHWGKWDVVTLVVIIAAIITAVNYFKPFGSSSSGTPTPAVPPPVSVEEDVKQPVVVSNHWVSAVPGKGMKRWEETNAGPTGMWWEGDVDLRIQGATGSLTFTLRAASFANLPDQKAYFDSLVGKSATIPIRNWKDNGTTIDFTTGDDQPMTVHLTRSTGGGLTGSGYAPPSASNLVGIGSEFNLVPAP